MNLLLPLFLLIAAIGGDAGGRLFVHIVPGFEVIVDGTSAGTSTAEVGGALVGNLTAGSHRVIVRSSDGREGSFAVSIVDGQMTTIDVSPLGLRKMARATADDDTGLLNVHCIPEGCTAQFRGASSKSDDLEFRAVPAGKYPVAVTEGKATLRMDVDIPAASIVTVQADFNAGAIRISETRRRPRRLQIAEANDALTSVAIPPYWKSDIRGVLPSGVFVIDAVPVVGNGVKVIMRVPSREVGNSLIMSLVNSTVFSKITAPTAPRKEGNGWVVDFTFFFPEHQ